MSEEVKVEVELEAVAENVEDIKPIEFNLQKIMILGSIILNNFASITTFLP